MKILLAVDGSKVAIQATKIAVRLVQDLAKPPTLVLMHADAPLMRQVVARIGVEAAQRYHQGNSRLAMKGARAVLKRAGVDFSEKPVVGEPAPSIVKAAEGGKFDLVVMGSQGRTALKTLLLGSVATKVLSQCRVPVMVVR